MDEQTDTGSDNGIDTGIKRRLSKVTTQRNEALASLQDLESQNLDLVKQAATSEALAGRISELEKQLSTQKTQHAQTLSLVDAGVADPEAREYLLHRYSKAGDEAGEFGNWLTDQRSNSKGLTAQILNPATIAAPEPETPTTEDAAPAVETAEATRPGFNQRQVPSLNRGTRPNPSPRDGLSPEAIADPNRSWSDIKAALGDQYGWGVDQRGKKR